MTSYSIVLGATGVIGEAFVAKLAKLGENLYLSGRSIEKLTLLKNKLSEINSKIDIKIFACDLADFFSVKLCFENFSLLNSKVSGLYYVSGVDIQKPFIEYTYEKIVTQARVNFEGALLFTNFALKNKA
ncbi:MAG: SDR family NAD(P)-dependent oxidoreductase, partial [Clostridia bacterium]|nr:SDR family NAD(P)-dependent oxidoreductase [Clostridia bacterium]